MFWKRIVPSLGLAVLLAACVPGTVPDREPAVIVINAPEERDTDGVAEAFVERIRELGTPGFDVVRNVAIAGLEDRSNLGGSRAVPAAARIARDFGAAYTLMLAPIDVEREVRDSGAGEVEIIVQLSVEGILVRGSDERVIARIASRTYTGQRFASSSEPLPEVRHDPTTLALATKGAHALAPVFREILADRVSGSSSE